MSYTPAEALEGFQEIWSYMEDLPGPSVSTSENSHAVFHSNGLLSSTPRKSLKEILDITERSSSATPKQSDDVSPRAKFKAQYEHRDTLRERFNILKQTIHKATGKKPTSRPDILDKANNLILYVLLPVCEPCSFFGS
jgi:hypothetical protein